MKEEEDLIVICKGKKLGMSTIAIQMAKSMNIDGENKNDRRK